MTKCDNQINNCKKEPLYKVVFLKPVLEGSSEFNYCAKHMAEFGMDVYRGYYLKK